MSTEAADTGTHRGSRARVDADPLVSVRNLKTHFHMGGKVFGGGESVVKAVDDVSFDIYPGEVYGLVGESGSGKSTMGRSILQLIKPTSGSVTYQGQDLVPLKEKDMRPLRRELGLIYQDPNAALNPAMTVAQGVGHPLWIHQMVETRAEARKRVAEMLERVGLSPASKFLDVYPDDLSGGQKQRLVIARTLITGPKFVVADEPVAALDMSVRARVLELMLELGHDLDLTYLFITHDLATARFMCDRLGILYLGKFVEHGDARRIFDDAKHPYTRSLLEAIPLPKAGRRNRQKLLPRGEIPDATKPPAGCPFHPRCRNSFALCGWEGRDLIDAFEQRWAQVPPEVFEKEQALVGDLKKIEITQTLVKIPTHSPAELASWLREVDLPSRVFRGVSSVDEHASSVSVRFRNGPQPGEQPVDGRSVSCHLYGIEPMQGGNHVGDPTAADVMTFPLPRPSWETAAADGSATGALPSTSSTGASGADPADGADFAGGAHSDTGPPHAH